MLVVAHGNSLRAIVKKLNNISEKGTIIANCRHRITEHSNSNSPNFLIRLKFQRAEASLSGRSVIAIKTNK